MLQIYGINTVEKNQITEFCDTVLFTDPDNLLEWWLIYKQKINQNFIQFFSEIKLLVSKYKYCFNFYLFNYIYYFEPDIQKIPFTISQLLNLDLDEALTFERALAKIEGEYLEKIDIIELKNKYNFEIFMANKFS